MEELRVMGGSWKGCFEYRYCFCIEEDNNPRWNFNSYMDNGTGNTRFVFETWTNFTVKFFSDDDVRKKIIDSEMFPTQFSEDREGGYENLEMSIGRRFKDYAMSDQEIHEFVGKAFAFAKKESEKSRVGHAAAKKEGPILVVMINLEVCTVQREGEPIDAVVDRAIRPRNLFPLNLCPWFCYARPKGVDEEDNVFGKIEDLYEFGFGLAMHLRDVLPRFRLGDEGDHDIDKWNCSICLRNPTVGDEVSSLECGHVFHYHCIVRWFMDQRTCPVCRRQAHHVKRELNYGD